MSTPQPPRWYCVNSRGITRLCGSKEDAEHRAKLDDIDFSRYAPHRAVQLVDVSELEKERTARIAAQAENEALKSERARFGLAHRKAVQEAAAEAVAAEREKKTPTWIDAVFRNMIAQRLYSQIRVEFGHRIGPWETFDAEAQQRIVDAIKPDGAT